MRASVLLLTLLILGAPAATAALTVPLDPPPVVHATLDTTAHRDAVARAIGFSMGFQQPDGGVYEYDFLGKDSNTVGALALWANAQSMDVRGPNLSALVAYFEDTQAVDGSWGSGYLVEDTTAGVLDGLLAAGYHPSSLALERALAYTKLNQQPDGSWIDGGGNAATYLTAQNLKVLLDAGASRDDDRVQRALEWLLAQQDQATGGFVPTPGWFTTPAATGLVLYGLNAYLAAPAAAAERVPAATVDAASAAAVAHLNATFDNETGMWAHSTGSNALIVGPAARYHAMRGLELPEWLLGGVQHLLDRQREDGAIMSWNGSPMLDYTLSGGRSLLEVQRALKRHDAVPIQVTWNDGGEYGDALVRVTLTDAQGVVRGAYEGAAGLATLSWRHLAPGPATLRVEAEGAVAYETSVWR